MTLDFATAVVVCALIASVTLVLRLAIGSYPRSPGRLRDRGG